MSPGDERLLTVRWRDRSFVLRAPEQVEELARRLRQKGLANVAVSITGAAVEGKTGSRKVLSDEERAAVCAVLTDGESDPALRRAFKLLCAEAEPLEANLGSKS
jgi:dsRNA-specific ribonuclease